MWAQTKFVAALVAFAARWKGANTVDKKYSALKTLGKAGTAAGVTFASGLVLSILQVFDAVELPKDWASFRASWPILAMSVGAGVLQAALNYWKNKNK